MKLVYNVQALLVNKTDFVQTKTRKLKSPKIFSNKKLERANFTIIINRVTTKRKLKPLLTTVNWLVFPRFLFPIS